MDKICWIGSKSKGENVEITWDDPEELDKYIHKLQKAAEKLTTENRKLRKCHLTVCEKVQTLMGVDLLRQQQKWKDGLMEIRHLMANLVNQVLNNLEFRYLAYTVDIFQFLGVSQTITDFLHYTCKTILYFVKSL